MMILLNTLQQALVFLPLTLGVYVSYRILAVTDLTVDGSFVFGAAIFAHFITHGYGQILSLLCGLLGGAVIGALVAIMQRAVKIDSLLASVLAVFMLYSVNFYVMGRPNISLLDANIFLVKLQTVSEKSLFIAIFVIALMVGVGLIYLLRSKLGLLLRAYGCNHNLLKNLGKPVTLFLAIGLALANLLAGFCGIINAQINGYVDINMGVGVALNAIGSVVIGQHLMHKIFHKQDFSVVFDCISCLIGSSLYFFMLNMLLCLGINPIYLKFLLGLTLVIFLSTANYSGLNRRGVI